MDKDKYIGTMLGGRYQIGELVGIGGMSNVYKAFDIKTNRVVAVKILRDEYLTNPEFLKRFKNESKAITALSSPNIVNVYDVSFNEQNQWIVMEYIDGITLKEYVRKRGRLSWQEAVYFTLQILRAVQHAHDKGIVHRDIKPQNIMLLKDGSVKVMDFGIARFARNDNKTITDKAIGSVHYISPEQAKGGNTDERTDIYSVGVILFEMLTGKLPFDADNPVSVALKQVQSQPLRPRQLNPSVPVGVDQVVMRSMKKNPADRYQSAAEMLSDLLLVKQNPAKVFGYDTNPPPARRAQTRGVGERQGGEAPWQAQQQGDEQTSWIKILVIISGVFGAVTVFVVIAALFLSGIFTSTKTVKVPDLLGEDYELIKDEPEYAKFDLQLTTTEYNDKFAAGEICGQTPKPGRLVKENCIISLKVSKGQKSVDMPDLVGMEAKAAAAELKNLGLLVKEINVFDNSVDKGLVIKTEPAMGGEVLLGSEATLYVSDGAENTKVEVPDLTKVSLESAKTMLENIKLELGAADSVNSEHPKDVVVRQDPPAGQEVEQGTLVNVQVSSGVTDARKITFRVPLPDIVRMANLKALLDGEVIQEEFLDLSEVRKWPIEFFGKGLHKVQVMLDDELLIEEHIDCDEVGKSIRVEDNTANFTTNFDEDF